MFREFLIGLSTPLHALRLILRNRTLLILSLLPIALTLVLYVFMLQYLREIVASALSSGIMGLGLNPEAGYAVVVGAVAQILLFFVAAITFGFTANIVAVPFNDLLSERTEKFLERPLPPLESSSFRSQLKHLGIDLGKTVLASLLSLGALVLSFVPVLNLIAFVIITLLLTFQYISFPQTRRAVRTTEGLKYLRQHFWACFGFGLVIGLLFALPVISILTLPLGVVGGTILVSRLQAP
jgi:CysZ protein